MRTAYPLIEGWHIRQLDTASPDIPALMREAAEPDDRWLTASMPAQVHEILLAHNRISDPHIGKNAADSAWVGEKDWAYACSFASPAPGGGPALLRFGGVDTFASVYLNGKHLGTFDNMFRQYAVDVKEHLAPAGNPNVLLIVFDAPLRVLREVQVPPEHQGKLDKHKYIRKAANDFGSYLGARPHSVKVGVYRDVVLDVMDRTWIEDVCVRTDLSKNLKQANVKVLTQIGGASGCAIDWALTDPDGHAVARGSVDAGSGSFEIPVPDPKLWWPHTHGQPNLYQLTTTLTNRGERMDQRVVTFGIRDVQVGLEDPATGEKRFQFRVNGQLLFLQGACWAPIEGMTHCWRPDRAKRLLDLAEHGHMNLMRVWAGGHVPPDEFYTECDRRGIFIWQDFMFEYGMYPAGIPAFDENCRAEVTDIIRQLRNHPSILLWVGGNENHMGWNFRFNTAPSIGRELFDKIIPEACATLDPARHYHPSSPFGGRIANWPLEGDWHDYSTLNYSHQSSVPTFISELGRVSAPAIGNMRRFLSEEELWPAGHDPVIRSPGQAAWPPMWQYRSVDGSWDKIGPIEEFCEPSAAEDLIRVLGTAHGEYLQRTVERLRRGQPDGSSTGGRRCGGNMVWRLNDAWPILYWSMIDYYLEPKIPYYFLRRAYAPVQVSFEQTPDLLAVWVVNDSTDVISGTVRVKRMRFDGTVLGELAADARLQPGESRRCIDTVDLGLISLRDEFLLASFGTVEATHLLQGERYLHLPRPTLKMQRVEDRIEIATDRFARQVMLGIPGSSGAVFEDNFFDMPPGSRRSIGVIDAAGGNAISVCAVNAEPVQVPYSAKSTRRT